MDGLVAEGTPRLRILSGLRLRRGLASRHLRSTPLLQKQSQPASPSPADFRQREGDQGTAEALRCQPEVGCEVVLLDWDWSVAEARCCQPEVGCEVVLLDWDWNVAEARCCQL